MNNLLYVIVPIQLILGILAILVLLDGNSDLDDKRKFVAIFFFWPIMIVFMAIVGLFHFIKKIITE